MQANAGLYVWVALSAMLGCEAAEPETPAPKTEQVIAANIPTELPPTPAIDDSSLRRAYAVPDMKLDACITVNADGSLVGKNCPAGCLVFGPYITAPANSDLSSSFEIESKSEMLVSSDVVSAGSATFHGSVNDQKVAPGQKSRLAQRLHIFQQAAGIETRLWVRAEHPTNFKLQFALEVQ
jgi:hypothetical protein